MNFDFSEEQKLLQTEARRFLREHSPAEKTRQVMDSERTQFDQTLWNKIAQQGWTGIAIPEKHGGHGYGYLELCLIALELGRALAPIPFASTVYLFTELVKSSRQSAKGELLGNIAKGELVGCLATSEQLGDALSSQPSTRFTNGKITGKKIAVVDAMAAHLAVVTAIDENGELVCCLVNLEQSKVSRSTVNSIDPSRPLATIAFEQTDATLMEFESGTVQTLADVLNRAAVLMAFEQVGGSEAALKMGIKYTKERFAFGRPVASFQAIKHKFADIYVANEIALSNAYYAAWALSTDSMELPLAAATARVSAIEAYFLASKESLQAHGGMGYTWEFDCHLHYRRAQHLALVLGGSLVWKEKISEQLLRAKTSEEKAAA